MCQTDQSYRESDGRKNGEHGSNNPRDPQPRCAFSREVCPARTGVLIGFAYAFHVVMLYPLLKWGIAVLITIPLCFLISLVIRKIPLVNRVV